MPVDGEPSVESSICGRVAANAASRDVGASTSSMTEFRLGFPAVVSALGLSFVEPVVVGSEFPHAVKIMLKAIIVSFFMFTSPLLAFSASQYHLDT